jgi:hypothetical protein
MRISPLQFRHDALDLNRLGSIELRGKGMMRRRRENRNRTGERKESEKSSHGECS